MLLMTGLIAFLATTEPAMAHPATGPTLPAVSAGANPFRSYVGGFVDGEGGSREVISIPADQDFILTALRIDGDASDIEVLHGAESIMEDFHHGVRKSYLGSGDAKLRLAGGAALTLNRTTTHGELKYYLQGYFVAGDSPHRFKMARTAPGGRMPIWTADEDDRDFLIRTLNVGTSSCRFYVDGVQLSPNSFPFDGSATHDLFSRGRGAFVLSAGSTLSVEHSMGPAETCDYFIEGQYIRP